MTAIVANRYVCPSCLAALSYSNSMQHLEHPVDADCVFSGRVYKAPNMELEEVDVTPRRPQHLVVFGNIKADNLANSRNSMKTRDALGDI